MISTKPHTEEYENDFRPQIIEFSEEYVLVVEYRYAVLTFLYFVFTDL